MSQIKPAEVSAILKKQLTGLDASASLDEVGNSSTSWGWNSKSFTGFQMFSMVS